MSKNLIEIQNEVIRKYCIDLCDGSKCKNDWYRTHAHVKQRRVCKWEQKSSIKSTFTLFHEIGHIETTTSRMRRCEEEYHATVWAVERMKEYGIAHRITPQIKSLYQNYIWREHSRGLNHNAISLPSPEELTIPW